MKGNRFWVLIVGAVLAAGTASSAGQVVEAGGIRHFDLTRKPDQTVLSVGGFFDTEAPAFDHRALVITVNGQPVTADHLLSPTEILRPRRPGEFTMSRIHDRSGGVLFPVTHESGGLADYDYRSRDEYDKWVPIYNHFPETIYISLRNLALADSEALKVSIYNNLGGTVRVGGIRLRPDFKLTELDLHEKRPQTDEYGHYYVPVWGFLASRPWAVKMAQERLRAADTGNERKGQILWSLGMLNLVNGHRSEAVRSFRRAVQMSTDFPEYNEVCYRLLHMTGEPPVDALKEAETGPGRWAALYNDYKAVVGEEPNDRPISVQWLDGEDDGNAVKAAWASKETVWHPVIHQIKGPEPPDGMATNEYALLYSSKQLILLFRGPGAPIQTGDVPGEDRPAWEFNCVEFFVAPHADMTRYYELNVTAANGQFDQRSMWHGVADPGNEYRGEWTSQTWLEDGRMHVEYRIPWSDFGSGMAPSSGDLWLANIIRVQFTRDEDEEKAVHREFSAGKLLWRYFHRVQDGRLLRFSGA